MKHNKIPPNSSIKDALRTMQLNNIRRLPIVEKEESDNMIGIITDQDVFTDYNENQNLIPILSDDELLTGLEISCIEDDQIVTL
jgi:predicted transcriptional regulator